MVPRGGAQARPCCYACYRRMAHQRFVPDCPRHYFLSPLLVTRVLSAYTEWGIYFPGNLATDTPFSSLGDKPLAAWDAVRQRRLL